MYSEGFPILSIITYLPLLGVLLILFLDREKVEAIRLVALFTALIDFIISLPLFFQLKTATAEFQFVEHLSWIPSLGISYIFGIDGISMLMVILTTLLTPLAIW